MFHEQREKLGGLVSGSVYSEQGVTQGAIDTCRHSLHVAKA